MCVTRLCQSWNCHKYSCTRGDTHYDVSIRTHARYDVPHVWVAQCVWIQTVTGSASTGNWHSIRYNSIIAGLRRNGQTLCQSVKWIYFCFNLLLILFHGRVGVEYCSSRYISAPFLFCYSYYSNTSTEIYLACATFLTGTLFMVRSGKSG